MSKYYKIIEWAGAPVTAAVKAARRRARRVLQLVVEYLLRDSGEALPVLSLFLGDAERGDLVALARF
jgi:hypothetical protein